MLALGGFLWLVQEHGLGLQTGVSFREILPGFALLGAGAMLLLVSGMVLLGDIARNESLDRPRKWLWAAVGVSAPPSLLAYWWVHVRPFSSDEEMVVARRQARPPPVSATRLGALLGSRQHKIGLAAVGVVLVAVILLAGLPVSINLVVFVAAAVALRLAQFPTSEMEPQTTSTPGQRGLVTSRTANKALVFWFAVVVPIFMVAFVVALLISET